MSPPNEVTIYSNGIADFRRRFPIPRGGEHSISLAFRRDHIGDVLGSLNVFGPVRIVRPPAYRPADDGSSTLAIRPDQALPELLRSFSGARLTVWTRAGGDDGVAGTILGLDWVEEVRDGRSIKRGYLGLYGDDRKIHRRPLDDITDYRFESDSDNAEIARALSKNYQSIKPHSTFVDLTLAALDDAEADAEAIVQVVIPLAAWKMTYRVEARGGDGFHLEGLAIVDNNTDEDWTNFLISVVTGEPNTFATDLAVAKTPRRRLVNLVPRSAFGGFQVAEGYEDRAMEPRDVAVAAPTPPSLASRGGGGGGYGGGGLQHARAKMELSAAPDDSPPPIAADREQAEATSVGDFQVFRSRAPVDIPARSSALVPMFARDLGDSRTILIYNQAEMPVHPFRAVRLVNDTGLNLSRGSCAVFRDGIFAGQGILDRSKPGEVRLVPHSLEVGVRVVREVPPVAQRLVRIRLTEGMVIQEQAREVTTSYTIRNKLDEGFPLLLEHAQVIPNSEMATEGVEVAHREKTAAGIRFEITLAPLAEKAVVTVRETRLDVQQVELTEGTLATVRLKGRFADDEQIAAAMEIKAAIDRKKLELSRHQASRKAALDKQARVQQLVAIARDGGGQQYNEWMKDLGESEKAIRDLDERVIPALYAEIEDLTQKLRDALKAIQATWETPRPKPNRRADPK